MIVHSFIHSIILQLFLVNTFPNVYISSFPNVYISSAITAPANERSLRKSAWLINFNILLLMPEAIDFWRQTLIRLRKKVLRFSDWMRFISAAWFATRCKNSKDCLWMRQTGQYQSDQEHNWECFEQPWKEELGIVWIFPCNDPLQHDLFSLQLVQWQPILDRGLYEQEASSRISNFALMVCKALIWSIWLSLSFTNSNLRMELINSSNRGESWSRSVKRGRKLSKPTTCI